MIVIIFIIIVVLIVRVVVVIIFTFTLIISSSISTVIIVIITIILILFTLLLIIIIIIIITIIIITIIIIGWKRLLHDREEMYMELKTQLRNLAKELGETVLETPDNPISIAFTLDKLEYKLINKGMECFLVNLLENVK